MPSFTVFRGSKDGSIHKDTTTKPDLSGDEVFIRVTASGLCFTDQHCRHNGMALGHEGAGIVEALGPDVKNLKVGTRVGFGYLYNSCGICEQCLRGDQIYCPKRELYMASNHDNGTIGSHSVRREAFVFELPSNIDDKYAAPLLCGGATVFTALNKFGADGTSKVGVLGVGGLGHLAIQYASKMGAEVSVFSGTSSKEKEAKELGATNFYATKGVSDLGALTNNLQLDFFLVTASFKIDWAQYVPLLAPGCKIFPITVTEKFEFPNAALIRNGLTIQGTLVASPGSTKKMLEFSGRHNIKPIIMEYPMTEKGIEDAFQDLNDGKMRYRGVLIPEKA